MKQELALPPNDTSPEQGWPERISRTFMVIVIAALVIGVPLVSMTLFSGRQCSETVVVEPDSHYAIHVGIYGIGKIQYSESALGASSAYLLVLDRINFERFEAGEDYEYSSYETIGFGGSGHAILVGPMWEMFFVFVNDGGAPVTLDIEIDTAVYLGYPAFALVLGAVVAASYANHIIRDGRKQGERRTPSLEGASSVKWRATIAMVGLAIILVTVVVVIGRVAPADTLMGLTSVMYRIWFGVLASTAVAFSLRLKLKTMNGNPEAVLVDLAHRLRVSRYRVSQHTHSLSVQISSTSAIRILAKPTRDGTLVSYRVDATPAGWSIMIILLLLNIISPFAMALTLFMLYRSTVFACERVLPRLSQLPVPDEETNVADTRMMLVDSLSEGRRLSAEAYEAARSNYQDAVISIVIASLILSAFIMALMGPYVLREFGNPGLSLSLLVGFATAAVFSIVSWRLLARRSQARISDLKAWTTRLDAALSREVASEPIPDGEPSSFELIAQSYAEIPGWVKARRKAAMFREPGYWLLIFFFTLTAFQLALVGAVGLWQGNTTDALLSLTASAASGSLVAAIYIRWRRRQETEDGTTVSDVTRRFETLKAEMETYIGSV